MLENFFLAHPTFYDFPTMIFVFTFLVAKLNLKTISECLASKCITPHAKRAQTILRKISGNAYLATKIKCFLKDYIDVMQLGVSLVQARGVVWIHPFSHEYMCSKYSGIYSKANILRTILALKWTNDN